MTRSAATEAERDQLPTAVADRVRAVLSGLALDCACRQEIDGALSRFVDLERRRERKRRLAQARDELARIEGLLELLHEVDTVAAAEPDHGVFRELACLFDDVAQAAAQGAAAMRLLAATAGARPG